jgi:hypothetical protein
MFHSRWSPAQHLETNSGAALPKKAKSLCRPGRQIDHDSLRAGTFGWPAIHHTHHGLLPVGEIRNANDGSERIRGVSRDHRRLVERHAAGRPFAVESRTIVGGETLSDLENLARFHRGRSVRGLGSAGGNNHNRQKSQPDADDRRVRLAVHAVPMRSHDVEVTQ